MAKPITDAERQRILELLATSKTHGQIAKEVGRSQQTVSRVAKAAGVDVDQSNLARTRRAHDTRKAYGAEHRAAVAALAQRNAERLLEQQFDKARLHNFNKDGDHTSVDLDQPVFADKRAIAAAVRDLMRTAIDVDRHDNRGDQVGSDFDRWLEEHGAGA